MPIEHNKKVLKPDYKIRLYTSDDYKTLCSWYEIHKETPPAKEFLPNSTFILEVAGEPMMSVSLILTNTPIAWIENLVSNPHQKGALRVSAVNEMELFLQRFAKDQGYKRLFGMSKQEKLIKRYKGLGYTMTAEKVVTFTKEIV